jgi:hypothetical protein
VAAAAVLAVLAGLLAPPAQAAVTGTVTVSAPDVAVPEGAETRSAESVVDFSVDTPDALEYAYYTYEVRVVSPDGYVALLRSSDFEGVGGDWQWRHYLLPDSPGTPYGTYSVSAVVNFYDGAGNVPSDTRTASDTFEFTGPPAPEPEPYETRIDGKVASTRYSKYLRKFSAVVQSEYRDPRPGETGIPVSFKLLVGKRVVATRAMTWSQTKGMSVRLPQRDRTRIYRVRVKENGATVFSRYYTVRGR